MNEQLDNRKVFAKNAYNTGVWNGLAFFIFAIFFLATGHLDNLLVFVVSFVFGGFSVITIFNHNTGYGFVSFLHLVRLSNILDRIDITLHRTGIPQPTVSGGEYGKLLRKKYGNKSSTFRIHIQEIDGSK